MHSWPLHPVCYPLMSPALCTLYDSTLHALDTHVGLNLKPLSLLTQFCHTHGSPYNSLLGAQEGVLSHRNHGALSGRATLRAREIGSGVVNGSRNADIFLHHWTLPRAWVMGQALEGPPFTFKADGEEWAAQETWKQVLFVFRCRSCAFLTT